MGNSKTSTIIAAIIGAVATIVAAFIGIKWGKNNVTIVVQQDGKNIILDDAGVQSMVDENEKLKNAQDDYEKQIVEYKRQIAELESDSADLTKKLNAVTGELEEKPVLELKNCGLSVNGDEKVINKENSYVAINGREYFSKEFIDNLLPENTTLVMKNEMLYVGKVVKSKANLLDMHTVYNSGGSFWDNITDTYGNSYAKILYYKYGGYKTIFNVKKEYTNFRCTIAKKEGSSATGYIQIETDDGNIVYTSPAIEAITEPIEIDIPINQASNLLIRSVGNLQIDLFVANAVLYNEG